MINKVRQILSNFPLLATYSAWFITTIIFAFLTQLDRSTYLFVQLLFLPFIGYLVLIYGAEKLEIDMDSKQVKIFWVLTILSRIIILMFPIGLSDDIYRYIWDGLIQQNGINPYKFAPNDANLSYLRTSWWSSINNKSVRTPYPPFTELLFWLMFSVSTDIQYLMIIYRLLMIGFNMASIQVIIKILNHFEVPIRRILYYAWSPLVLFEYAGNAHNDAIAVFFMLATIYLVLTRKKGNNLHLLGAISLAIGIATKYFPFVVIPFVMHKWRVREWILFVVTLIGLSIPYLGAGVFPYLPPGQMNFIMYFRFNESLYRLYKWIFTLIVEPPQIVSRIFYVFVMTIIGMTFFVNYLESNDKNSIIINYIMYILLFALLLGPEVHPWYLLWVLPFGIIRMNKTVITFSLTVLLSYFIYPQFDAYGIWQENPWILILEYIPVYLFLFYELYFDNRSNKYLTKFKIR